MQNNTQLEYVPYLVNGISALVHKGCMFAVTFIFTQDHKLLSVRRV